MLCIRYYAYGKHKEVIFHILLRIKGTPYAYPRGVALTPVGCRGLMQYSTVSTNIFIVSEETPSYVVRVPPRQTPWHNGSKYSSIAL